MLLVKLVSQGGASLNIVYIFCFGLIDGGGGIGIYGIAVMCYFHAVLWYFA